MYTSICDPMYLHIQEIFYEEGTSWITVCIYISKTELREVKALMKTSIVLLNLVKVLSVVRLQTWHGGRKIDGIFVSGTFAL